MSSSNLSSHLVSWFDFSQERMEQLNTVSQLKGISTAEITNTVFSVLTSHYTQHAAACESMQAHLSEQKMRLDETDFTRYALCASGALFDELALEEMNRQFDYLLQQYLHDKALNLSTMPMLDETAYIEIDEQSCDIETALYEVKTACQLFADQVQRIPNHIALDYQGATLSYKALDDITNQLARYIRRTYLAVTHAELKPDTLIPISIARSSDFVIGILAILKAGGAFVPINPDYPQSRIEYILKDINSSLILTDRHSSVMFQNNHSQLSQILLDERAFLSEDSSVVPEYIHANHLAYVIYTSGSSGNPKGVLATHVTLISQGTCANYFKADESDTMTFFSDVSFDSTTFEIWGALLNGATLFIPDNFFDLLSDPTLFKETVISKHITIILLTRSLFDLLYTLDETVFASLKYVLVGGEALTKHIMHKLVRSPYKPQHLINAYGPTENSTFCTTNDLQDDFSELNSVPIGRPYSNRVGIVVDKYQQIMPMGVTGELYVGGPSLSRGYLNHSALTEEKFINNPFFHETGGVYPRVYKTNDLVKWLPNGQLEFAGRNDFQVKLRGYRIELAEIETRLLEFSGIKHSVVVLENNNNLSYLVGYYVADAPIKDEDIKAHLNSCLPEYMVPSVMVYLDKLPVTTNGKLDRKALPKANMQKDVQKTDIRTESSVRETIIEIWSGALNTTHIGLDDSFFNLGGNSLAAMMVRKRLEDAFDIKLSIVDLFQHTTVNQLALFIQQGKSTTRSQDERTKCLSEDIAVVGMSCRLPGIDDPVEFWQLLCDEKSTVRDFSNEELRIHHVAESNLQDEEYVKRAGILDASFSFDASFFNYSVKDAEMMDPQQRHFLECSWEALEASGNVPEKFTGDIGVFATQGRNHYFMERIVSLPLSKMELFQAILANENDFLSTRVSYKLNLTGPSITLQTACSSSLVAIQMACDNLNRGGCDMALAGGVSLFYRPGYVFQKDLIESPDGYCRAFDASAEGTIVTSGVGIVVLKRLSDAIEQNDTIYAVVKGGAINNDGAAKMAFTAPGVQGQMRVIEKAQSHANITPDTIEYVEAHGTGTALGDPIEWSALHGVYQKYMQEGALCTIGSVKTNIGHTDSAAGVFGFMKAVLALKHQLIPATLYFETLNAEIASFNTLFRVSNKTKAWESNHSIRRAAVSSFGLGGTNAHVILEEYIEPCVTKGAHACPYYLIPFSAKQRESLQAMATHLKDAVFINSVSLPSFAYTAQEGRAEFKERGYFIVSDDLSVCDVYLHEAVHAQNTPLVVVLSAVSFESLTGVDELYQQYPIFAQAFDVCVKIIQERFGIDLKFPLQNDGLHGQLALFSVQYALVTALMSLMHKPVHGFRGAHESACVIAALAGFISLDEALDVLSSGQSFVHPSLECTESYVQSYPSRASDVIQSVAIESISPPAFLTYVGTIWSSGVAVDWNKIRPVDLKVKKIRIPTYQFIRKEYELPYPSNEEVVVLNVDSNAGDSFEVQLKQMWSSVLGVSTEELTHASDFIELGGDSISFIDLSRHIKKSWNIPVDLEELLQQNEFGAMLHSLHLKMV